MQTPFACSKKLTQKVYLATLRAIESKDDMAIGFARLQFVKRSEGKTSCAKAAYNARERVHFLGTDKMPEKTYDWSYMEKPIYHSILLPKNADEKFKNIETLWNAAEQSENRINSQVALDMLLALPDDESITEEDRIFLANSFVEKHLVSKGLAAQINIHQPDEKNGKKGHNWHAHILVTTRRFTDDGKDFGEKARDLVPSVRGGKVISGPNWESLWTSHQNEFFKSKGISLSVDLKGAVPQIHLGPIRMRGRAFALLEENESCIELNYIESTNPHKILQRLTETKSVFTKEDLEKFLIKHVDQKNMVQVRENFWRQEAIVPLLEKKFGVETGKFSTKEVIQEEQLILRLADRIHKNDALRINKEKAQKEQGSKLNQEQKQAFANIIGKRRLICIEGHAGTGKSYLMGAVRDAYIKEGYQVRAFGPDNATADVLKEKGFDKAENVYRFLFSMKNGQRKIATNEVWIIDEAGKLGNQPLAEILRAAEANKAQLLLVGCSSQMSSVGRGGMFKILGDRYGFELLENVQRQKEEEQKAIARNLAQGKMSEALDGIISTGGFKWVADKREAIEELSKKWAMDRLSGCGSDLIIAHTNSEVKVLNEMVRLCRQEQGEIEEEEYECDTVFGKVYLSVGDKIEFRKNDHEVGVTNGMKGVLVKASPEKFVVSVKNGDNTREIAFDPTKYGHFQLGYATTFYRAQGATVDRAYVLHSPMMNKEMFYVGLTRHVRKVHLFVSKTDATCLADLKRQAYRASLVETSLSYQTSEQIEKEKADRAQAEKIETLKSSNSLLSKATGYGMSAWGGLLTKGKEVLERHQDRSVNKTFFNPELPEDQLKLGKPRLVEDKDFYQENAQEIARVIAEKQKNKLMKPVWKEKAEDWKTLSESTQQLIKEYQKSWQHVVSLRSDSPKGELTASSRQIQEVCAIRNKLAFKVLQTAEKDSLKRILGEEGFEILIERSLRHESVQEKMEKADNNIEENLKMNIEPLLYALFPEGPTRRDRQGFRYGAKGSLSVACSGKNMGCYHDFEKGEGGGPIHLIQKTKGIGYTEALDYARTFLGEKKVLDIPPRYLHTKAPLEKSGEWISLVPPKEHAPSLKEISKKLESKYEETARYPYCNENGRVLFYTLRLCEKQKPESKIVIPLSYGYWKGEKESPCWWLKGYQANEGKPLYNLAALTKNPEATVLVVEGEKTADAAQHMFKDQNIVSVTWSGGAGSVSKTNWDPLLDRKVIIWPDNDLAGYNAAQEVCSALRQVGVRSLHLVDKEMLEQTLPAKWDLADPLPDSKDMGFVKDMLLKAKEKTVNFDQFLYALGAKGNLSLAEKLQVREILWRVEERLRPILEKHESRFWEVNKQILSEAQRMYGSRDNIEKKLLETGVSGHICKSLAYHSLLYEARTGAEPSQCTIEQIKETLINLGRHEELMRRDSKLLGIDEHVFSHALDKKISLAFACEDFSEKESGDKLYRSIKNDVCRYAKIISTHCGLEKDANQNEQSLKLTHSIFVDNSR